MWELLELGRRQRKHNLKSHQESRMHVGRTREGERQESSGLNCKPALVCKKAVFAFLGDRADTVLLGYSAYLLSG